MESRRSIRWQIVVVIFGIIFSSFIAFFIVVHHFLIEDYQQLMLNNDLQRTQIISYNVINSLEHEFAYINLKNFNNLKISPVHYSNENQDLTFNLINNETFVANISLQSVINFIKHYNQETSIEIYLIDQTGTAIIHPDNLGDGLFNYYNMTRTNFQRDEKGYFIKNNGQLIFNETKFTAPQPLIDIIHAAVEGKSGQGEFKDNNGKHYFYIYKPIELQLINTKWSIILAHSAVDMIANLEHMFSNAILIGLIILLIASMTIMSFAEKLVQPIFKIVEMANRVRAGDLSGQLKIDSDNEIGLLADNINHMIQGLRATQKKRKEAENYIRNIAYHDTLTGLPNRMHFMVYLREMLDKSVMGRFYGSLIFIDVDKFKMINDTYGHAIGDGLLIAFAKRIIEIAGRKEIACRYGGDEFLLFLPGYNFGDTESTCKRLVMKMREPFNISGHEFELSASVGAAMFPQDADNIDELMEKADAALYVSKRNGRDQYNFYIKDMTIVKRQ